MKRILIFAMLAFMFGACSQSEKAGEKAAAEKEKNAKSAELDSETIFKQYCGSCHQMKPPAKIAPPVLGIAAHYREAFKEDKDAAIAHMVDFIQSPDSSKSKLEARAIKRFGVMPTIPLSEEELQLAVGWLWDQYDPDFECGGGKGGHGHGHGHGEKGKSKK